jgi:hypothetical protein
MKKEIPIRQERPKVAFKFTPLRANKKGTNAIQAKNPRSKFGKERTRRIAEERADRTLIMPVAP